MPQAADAPSSTAAFCILVPPAATAASYTKASLGAQWALIQAETVKAGLPSSVAVGMFNICYASPVVACTPFRWGLSIGTSKTKTVI